MVILYDAYCIADGSNKWNIKHCLCCSNADIQCTGYYKYLSTCMHVSCSMNCFFIILDLAMYSYIV